MENLPTAKDVLDFWFKELTPKQHFKKDASLDTQILNRFGELYKKLSQSLDPFTDSIDGKRAAILVFDQFARNMFRDQAKAFENDNKALQLAKEIISLKEDQGLSEIEKSFIYMPFMHAENLEEQAESIRLFKSLDNEDNLRYAKAHYDVIERFGRFPHRNEALNRKSTPEEIIFIKTPGTAF